MDYEKYKEALERAKIWQKHLYEVGDKDYADELNYIFPELAMSEDEKIRKALIDFFSKGAGNGAQTNGVYDKDILAWLEKQESVGEIVSRCKKSWYNEGKIAGMAEGLSNDDKYQQGWHDALEKQGEQKTWLNSLKNRVIQQPKSTWSEKDEQHIDSLLRRLDGLCRNEFERTRFAISEDKDWLESLKDRMKGG